MLQKKKNKKPLLKKKVEKTYHKLFIYVIILNEGYAEPTMNRLKEQGSNVQFVALGKGTAKKEVLHMMGFEDNPKDIVLAFVDDTNVESIQTMLEKYFNENKKIMGVGFTLKLNSVVGEKLYHFLTNTI